jgi:hypothetical protein
LGDAQGAGGEVFLHITELFERSCDAVHGGLRKIEKGGEFGLGCSVGAGGESLKQGESTLKGGRVLGAGYFHG